MGVGPIWVDVQKRELGTNNGWELRACDNTKKYCRGIVELREAF